MTTQTLTKPTNSPFGIKARTALFAALSAVLALGAAEAYAAENVLVDATADSRTWSYAKTAVTPTAAVARADAPALGPRAVVRNVEELPDLVVPLNTDMDIRSMRVPTLAQPVRYSTDLDLRDFDLVEDNPVFIGAQSVSEFDTLDAQRESGAYPTSLGVDPMVPVAGAGVATSF